MEATWPPSPAPVMSPRSEDRKSRVVSFSAAKGRQMLPDRYGPVSKGVVILQASLTEDNSGSFYPLGPDRASKASSLSQSEG